MSESIITLWINSETNTLLPSWNSFGTGIIPSIKQGDLAKVEIHWIKSDSSGNFMQEIEMSPTATVKVAVGSTSGGPSSGYFTYNYQGDTVEIPYDSAEQEINTLINSLPSIVSSGGVSVSIINQRTIRIVFNDFGQRAISSCDSTTLSPSTNIYVTRINAGSVSSKEVQHLRPKLTPIAYSDSFSNSPSPVLSLTDVDSITKRISIYPFPKYGTFTISNGTVTTNALSINSSSSDILNALSTSGISSSTRNYSVAKSGEYSWDIYRTSGTSETLTVSNSGIIGFSSKYGVIDFNTIEVEDYLAGNSSASATIEVEYSDGVIKHTIYQGTVLIVNDLIENSTYSPIPFPEFSGGIEEAPQDGSLYARKDGVWTSFQEEDNQGITQSAGDARYAQRSNNLSDLSDASVARTNLDTYSTTQVDNYLIGKYDASNPSGYIQDANADGNLYGRKDGQWELIAPTDLTGYATESWVSTGFAPISSPAFTGVPTAPTPIATDNSTTIATTAYVTDAIATATTSVSTERVIMSVLNQTGSTISAGSVVYIIGANGTHPTIALAQADSELTSYRTLGMTANSILNGSNGTVVLIGNVTNLNTNSFEEGDQLYLSPTVAGGLTNSKPSAPYHMVYVGVCVRKNQNNGVIQVRVANGYELGELHNVSVPNSPVNNNILAYESSSSLWKNKTASSLGIAELSGATFSGKVGLTSTATSSALNINPISSAPSSPSNGDIWIQNTNIRYIGSDSVARTVPSLSSQNFFYGSYSSGGGLVNIQNTSASSTSLSVTGFSSFANSTSSNTTGTVLITNEAQGPALRVTTGNVTTAEVVVIESKFSAGNALRITNTGTSNSLVVEDSANPDSTSFIINADGNVGIGIANGWSPTSKFEVVGTSKFSDKASFTSVSGAAGINIGIGGVSTTAIVAGDIWISTGGTSLNYRDATGAWRIVATQGQVNTFSTNQIITGSTSAAMLRITQTGAGNAFVVEDAVNPDTSSFVIDANGNVGIGADPATWAAVNKLEVSGYITSTTATNKTNSTVVATTAFVKNSIVPTIAIVSSSPYDITNALNWNSILRCTASSAVTINVPSDTTSNVEIGTQIVVIQTTSGGQVTFNPDAGVVLMSSGLRYKTNGQYSVCTLIKTASNEWILGGDLTA